MSSLPKILIIDDEFIIRTTLESLFAGQDVRLLFAGNGEEGLALAQEHLPDAILLDVMMPGMDGYETCRRIRSNPALAETHIIMITALDDRNARLAGLLAGADDFLTKPFDGVEIQIRIKHIVRMNRYRNLLEERSRFHWAVEHAAKGYLLVDEWGTIQYSNQQAQVYLHLPQGHSNINFEQHAARYYQPHLQDDGMATLPNPNVGYLVQPESETARAFWLRVETLDSPSGNQRLICLSDVSEEMAVHHDIRKFHLVVAHKLRAPVAHIYSSINLLDTSVDLLPDTEVKPLVKTAWKGANRLMQQVQDILQYIDAPVSLSQGEPVTIAEVRDMTESVATTLEISGITSTGCDDVADQKLGISCAAMEVIIYEILENSKKFHPLGNPRMGLTIKAERQGFVKLSFTDDGSGMTAGQIVQAARPYLQGEKWFTGETPGMGLGIPMIASLVWQSGGTLHISNQHSQTGTCITLELPVAEKAGSAAQV